MVAGAAASLYFYSRKKDVPDPEADENRKCSEVHDLVLCDCWATCMKEYILQNNGQNQRELTREELRARLLNLIETHCIDRWLKEKELNRDRYELWLEENQ